MGCDVVVAVVVAVVVVVASEVGGWICRCCVGMLCREMYIR
jgi:hypothetical protein